MSFSTNLGSFKSYGQSASNVKNFVVTRVMSHEFDGLDWKKIGIFPTWKKTDFQEKCIFWLVLQSLHRCFLRKPAKMMQYDCTTFCKNFMSHHALVHEIQLFDWFDPLLVCGTPVISSLSYMGSRVKPIKLLYFTN